MNCCGSSDKQKSVANQLSIERLENKTAVWKKFLVGGFIIVFIIGFLASLH